MIETVKVNKTITVPAERLWSAIANIDGLERWFPVIASCNVVGSGVGAKRILTLTGGGEMIDIIQLIDHQHRRLQYLRTVLPFPVSHYLGTVAVKVAPEGSEICWMVEIDVHKDQRGELLGFLRQALTDGVAGLARELLTSTECVGQELS